MNLKTLVCLNLITLIASLTPAHAQTFSVIHTFTDTGGDGGLPTAGLTVRGDTLYGTTQVGGPGGFLGGTVYQITHVGSDWITTPIFLFPADGSGGTNPRARLVFGPDGHAYSTTEGGGIYRQGVLFSLTPPLSICRSANCLWNETILHSFQDSPGDGSVPGLGDLTWDQQGNLYGTTTFGGKNSGEEQGTVFQMNPGTKAYSVIHYFSGSPESGRAPVNEVVFDDNGNLFGTTVYGGQSGYGTIFELTHANNWQETDLYSFALLGTLKAGTGYYPEAGLVRDSSGNFYGATSIGGSGGGGVVFELSPSDDSWVYTPIYSLKRGGGGPCGISGPIATLTMDAAGDLYGTTLCDGANGYGNVFKLTNTQNGWTYASLYDFTGADDGAYPTGNVTIDANGTFYGTALLGGDTNCDPPCGCGVVWIIDHSGIARTGRKQKSPIGEMCRP